MANADTELFNPDLVFFDLDCTDQESFFKALHDELDKRGYIQDTWYEGITTREKNYATGLRFPSIEIAIPHTDPQHLKKPYIAVIKPKTPIHFEHMAGADDDVDAVLMINLGVERDGGQVEVLQNLMNIFMNDEAVTDIMAQDTPEGMVETITKYFA